MELTKVIDMLQEIAHEGHATEEVLICAPDEEYFQEVVGAKSEDGTVEVYIK